MWAAARVHWALGGRNAVVASDFPYALVPALAAVLAFCLVLTVLDGGILALGAGAPPTPLGQWGGCRYGGPGAVCSYGPWRPSACTGSSG